jgi:tetratricopeptide (TPR) repeat protein
VYLKKIGVLCLFFLTAQLDWAQQQLPNRFDWSTPMTPAQSDWWLNHADDFAIPTYNQQPPSGQRISVTRLHHKPPKDALRVFMHGVKMSEKNLWQNAASDFERAVALDPDFSEAHGNLGVAYTGLRLLDRAASEFRRAIELDPATSVHHANLAVILIEQQKWEEAEPEAQKAVNLDPSSTKAHYLLGYLLARRPEARSQAEPHLVIAARELPEAHYVLAEIYSAQGADSIAQAELNRYQRAAAASSHGMAFTGK